jgi:hypothetical protein
MSDSTNNITRDKYGKYHSYDDKPARIDEDGTKYWYIHGRQKRENIESPFIECSNGNKYFRLKDGGYQIISYDQNGVMTQLNTYYENGRIEFEKMVLLKLNMMKMEIFAINNII